MIKSLISTLTATSITTTANSTLNQEGEIIPKEAKKLRKRATTTSLTSSTVTLATEYHNYKEFYLATNYINSLSDEELASTLEQLNLLEKDFEEGPKELTKTRG